MVKHFNSMVGLILLAGIATVAAFQPAQAQSRKESAAHRALSAAPAAVRSINLGEGKSIILDLPGDASEIFVADPKIANAIVRSARKLYIVGVAGGQTSIYAIDAQGHRMLEVEISVGRDMVELERILRTAMPKAEIVLKTIDKTIILTGTVENAGEAQMAMDIARGFVGSGGGAAPAAGGANTGNVINSLIIRGRDQVMLKVTIAEVQRQVMKQLGITNAVAQGSWGSWNYSNPFLQSLSSGRLSLGPYGDISNGSIAGLSAQLQAYEKTGVGRILAEPTVTAVSGETARFNAGGEIPVPSSESCSTATNVCTVTVTFRPYGVVLNFTPVVLGDGRIQLKVATEVTEIDPTTSFNLTTSSVSGFRTRKNDTTVELPSGGSIVTAGLLQSTTRQTINGLPGLMNLPILGALFRSKDYQRQETELMIIVTPFIAKPSRPQELARPTDGLVPANDGQFVLLGRMNQLYSTTDNPQLIRNFKGRVGFITD